ncbi:hypothetical protein RIF29_27890 [Crotalaria pallida]|uniref:C2 domain-containing protein n=1 Tax=Crotalaria pallida TaxID=3830 RepID=A0AAN9EQL1_CROPI
MQKPQQSHPFEFDLKETKPNIGGVSSKGKLSCTYDLVEQMQYLYVHVVKAKDLPGNIDSYVEVKLGNYRGLTKHFENRSNHEWNQVFAFSKDRIQASLLEVAIKNKEELVGRVFFDLVDISKRVPPDSPLAPQWYRMEDSKAEKSKGELMLAVWMGTQADEAFPDAWNSEAAMVSPELVANIRSKVYLSPKLWYVRVNVIEAQDLVPSDKSRYPEAFVKVSLGNQSLRTTISQCKTLNPMWNEDLMFVVAEPYEESLIITAEDRVGQNKAEILGRCVIPLHNVQRRLDDIPVNPKWFNLEKHEGEQKKETQFSSRLHLRVCLDGGYHVLDESAHYSSDLRPTAKQLWKRSIGILEVGIISARGLFPMKTRDGQGTTDAYCVAKYGQKWIRTRTIVDSLAPKWNEQYTWEVYDPCTVITIGVFDNGHIQKPGGDKSLKDSRIGKVRIRLSTLSADRVYTHSYPLLLLNDSGLKKMGEVELAVRFSSLSLINMLFMYSQPMFPKMHHVHPLPSVVREGLRCFAAQIVLSRLSRAEPPLRKEVVEYMLDVDSNMWSVRRSKANVFRIMNVLSRLVAIGMWFDYICSWKQPLISILFHLIFMIFVFYPGLILPLIFIFLLSIGIWNFRWRPRHPPHMETKLSHADVAHIDELDEELDTFPTSKSFDTVKARYDRLRCVAGRVQTVLGDVASQLERFQNLLSWRDPRATTLFVTFCLIAAIVLLVIPFRAVTLLIGFYVLRHPRFRNKLPSVPFNFFRRLPSRVDSIF